MILTEEQIQSITFGTVGCEKKDDYLAFYRMTPFQKEAANAYDFAAHTFASSGIRFCLSGNVKKISFSYRVLPCSKSQVFYGIDVYENDEMQKEIFETTVSTEGIFTYEARGTGDIVIYFPHLQQLLIKDVDIEGTFYPTVFGKKICYFGDSITQGYNGRHPGRIYAARLSRYLHADFLDAAIGGDVFRDGLVDPAVSYEPDLIITAYGTNDWQAGRDVARECRKFFQTLKTRYPFVPIYAVGPLWRIEEGESRVYAGKRLADVRNEIKEACEEMGIRYVDGSSFVPANEHCYAADYLHPMDEGFFYYVENLKKTLEL